MLIALIQQSLIFAVLFYTYSNHKLGDFVEEQIEEPDPFTLTPDDNFIKNCNITGRSLAIVDELKWVFPPELLLNVIIDERFKIGEQLGDGYTGFVRSGIDLRTGEEVAIKFASKSLHYSLEREFENYLYLGADDPNIVELGIPHIIHFGDFGGYKVLIMTKTGPTVGELMYEPRSRKLTIKTICKIAMQAVRIIEYIHSKGLIFHDMKPSNMAVGQENPNQVFLFDFAFAEFYVNAFGEPKEREEANGLHGTPEYMARGPLNGLTHVRKDDLISLGIVLLDLNGAGLPWMKKTKDDDSIVTTMDIVLEEWDKNGIEEICDASENPNLFLDYFVYLDTLESYSAPDYDRIVEMFASELTDEDLDDEDLRIFDADNDYETESNDEDEDDDREREESLSGDVIDERFQIGEGIGDGFTGFVRSGIDLKTGNEVAIKFAGKKRHYSLEKEYINYLYLGGDDPDVVQYGIPHLIHYGDFGEYKVMVLTKTGPTLRIIRPKLEGKKFEFESILKIGMQAVRIFQYIHSKDLIFQDVRPSNMAIGLENPDQLFFFDFAFSEFYVDAFGEPKRRELLDYINGSPEYMARGPLHGLSHHRKDDFISFGLVLLELNGARLPWKNDIDDEDSMQAIMDIVLDGWEKYPLEEIVENSDHPQFFLDYFQYFDTIESHEEPDYDALVKFFENELTDEEIANESLAIF